MTVQEFRKLKADTRVRWREGDNSPQAGLLTDFGVVVIEGRRRFARWQDGQETDGFDDWALQNVELDAAVQSPESPRSDSPTEDAQGGKA